MKRARGENEQGVASSGHGDLLILASGVLPALVLGVAWMRQVGVPGSVFLQNLAAAVAGGTIAAYGRHRQVSPGGGLAVTAIAVALLLATLIAHGVQGVHRWITIGPLSVHVASLVIPLVLVELDRLLRHERLSIAFSVMIITAGTLAVQPDAGQATAWAGAAIALLAVRKERLRVTVGATLALLALAAASFFRSDPLTPVPYVEEIAIRIGQRGATWAAGVVIALALLIVPFVLPAVRTSKPAAASVAVYLSLCIAASCWGNFPVPVLGYGVSPIIGYLAGWTWLRAAGPTPVRLLDETSA
jgi:hypothetical protein